LLSQAVELLILSFKDLEVTFGK